MKKMMAVSISSVALAAVMSVIPAHAQQYGPPPGPPQGYQQGPQQQWDAPPAGFNELNRRAFHDGMDAARNDWMAHRKMDPRFNAMYRRPPAPRPLRDEYRSSFARGYQVAMEHRERWQDHRRKDWDHGPR